MCKTVQVLHIVPDGDLGGGAIFVARLIKVLGADSCSTVFLPAQAAPALLDLFAGYMIVQGSRYRSRGSVFDLVRDLRLLGGDYDMIHAHGTRAAMGAALTRDVGGLRLPILYTVHGYHGLAQPGPAQIRLRLERLLARRCDAVSFVSHADEALAKERRIRPRVAEVIVNGVSVPEAEPVPRDIDVLFVGRFVFQKYPEAFLQAVADLLGAPRIVMIGTGALEGALRALARDKAILNFEFAGMQPLASTLAHMRRARLLVMTSRWEGLPTVAIEAILSGALVTGYRIPPLTEILHPLDDRLLVPLDNAPALHARISGLLAAEDERQALLARIQPQVRDVYDPRRMAQRYLDLYARLAA